MLFHAHIVLLIAHNVKLSIEPVSRGQTLLLTLRYFVSGTASQVTRLRYGALYLGRLIWDALSETLHLRRFLVPELTPALVNEGRPGR